MGWLVLWARKYGNINRLHRDFVSYPSPQPQPWKPQHSQPHIVLFMVLRCMSPSCNYIPIKNGLKQRDALLPLLFNRNLIYTIRRVKVN
jgi:hypothetical protein